MALIDLEKKVGIVLEKRNLPNPPTCRVGLAIDISGSMRGLYGNGTVQKVVDRMLAVSMKFDDNGELDIRTFENRVSEAPTATAADFENYVDKHILHNSGIHKWGGTSYAPVIESLVDFYFPHVSPKKAGGLLGGISLFCRKKEAPASSASQLPALVIFITDGANDDERATREAINAAANERVYWQFVGIGDVFREPDKAHKTFVYKLAEELPNAGFMSIENLETISDDTLFERLISEELVGWLKK